MTIHLGDVPASSTLYIPFATYDANGASVTLTGLAVTDIEIYKNGSVTQRASDAGYALLDTDGIDFDAITGLHGFSVNLSDNTDAGFYSAGAFYWVVVSTVTISAQTVTVLAATFRIREAETTAGRIEARVASIAAGAIDATAIATGAIDADALAADAGTEIANAVLTTAMTESYSADGGTMTLAQALYQLCQYNQDRSIASTTMTVKKVDGTTTAYTITLNDATTPTSVSRAT